jgi:hypothetical protein
MWYVAGYNYSKDAQFRENETDAKLEMRNVWKDLVKKTEENTSLDLEVNGKIALKWILNTT